MAPSRRRAIADSFAIESSAARRDTCRCDPQSRAGGDDRAGWVLRADVSCAQTCTARHSDARSGSSCAASSSSAWSPAARRSCASCQALDLRPAPARGPPCLPLARAATGALSASSRRAALDGGSGASTAAVSRKLEARLPLAEDVRSTAAMRAVCRGCASANRCSGQASSAKPSNRFWSTEINIHG
jgi:hypothetical protein